MVTKKRDTNINIFYPIKKKNTILNMNLFHKIEIDKAMNILNPREKKIIRLYYIYGYKEKELADLYKLSHQRINKIKSRALEKMNKFLIQNFL